MELNIHKTIWSDWLQDVKFKKIITTNILNQYPILKDFNDSFIDDFLKSLSMQKRCMFFLAFNQGVNKKYTLHEYVSTKEDTELILGLFEQQILKKLPQGEIIYDLAPDIYQSYSLYHLVSRVLFKNPKKKNLIREAIELIKLTYNTSSYYPYYLNISEGIIEDAMSYIQEKGNDFTAALVAADSGHINTIFQWGRENHLILNTHNFPFEKVTSKYGSFYPEDFDVIKALYDKYHIYFNVYPNVLFFEHKHQITLLESNIKRGDADFLRKMYQLLWNILDKLAKNGHLLYLPTYGKRSGHYNDNHQSTLCGHSYILDYFIYNIFGSEKNSEVLCLYQDLFEQLHNDTYLMDIDQNLLTPKMKMFVAILTSSSMKEILVASEARNTFFNIQKIFQRISNIDNDPLNVDFNAQDECDLFI